MSPDQPPVNVNVNQSEPSITITLREVYDGLNKKFDELAVKLDDGLTPLASLPKDVEKLETRVRDLEVNTVTKSSARWVVGLMVGPIVALIAAVLGVIFR